MLGAPTPHSRDCAVPQRRVNASHRHKAPVCATSLGGHYMDQFTYAERATDWRGNNNIANQLPGRYGVPSTIRTFSSCSPAAPPVGSRSPLGLIGRDTEG